MPKFAANLSMMFTERPFLERFAAAAAAGFDAVEFMFPYENDPGQLADILAAQGLTLVLHNLPAGDWAGGERGIACHPARTSEIGHIQLADNPGRHEPGTGEVNFPFLFAHLDALGYAGWVGCEYKPRTTTEAGLHWVRAYQTGRAVVGVA